jgi:hypothetical protein
MSLKFYGDGRVENLLSVDIDLDDIQDVDLTTSPPSDGDVLTYFDGEDAGWGPGQIDPPPSTTDELTEGTNNLYYTDARADARIAAADTDDISEGQTNLYYTDARALGVSVDKTGDTMTGILTAPNYNVGVTQNFNAESVFVDFSSGNGLMDLESNSGTPTVVFSGGNYTVGAIKTIRLKNTWNTPSAITVSFPADWVFVGSKPVDLAHNKVAILTLTSFRDTASGVVAGWVVEE